MNDLPTHPDDLLALFSTLSIVHDLIEHEAVFTVAQSESLNHDIPGTECRNLFLKDKKGRLFLVVLANETQIKLKDIEPLLGSARLSFGSKQRLWDHLGVHPGSVCPFAAINDPEHKVQIILDQFMMKQKRVNYHPLINTMTVGLSPDDLIKFFTHTGHTPKIIDFSMIS